MTSHNLVTCGGCGMTYHNELASNGRCPNCKRAVPPTNITQGSIHRLNEAKLRRLQEVLYHTARELETY